MLRLARTVTYIVGFAAVLYPKLENIKAESMKAHDTASQDMAFFQTPKKWAEGILKRAGVKVIIEGNENIPDGPVLIVSNHEGNFDIPVLIHAIDKPFGFVSKVEVKKIPFLEKWMDAMNCIYLDRSDRRSSLQMIKDGTEKLKDGHSILIFPEGTRSKGKGLQEFKGGSFKLAKTAGVPILPVAIKGTSDIMEKYNSRKMKPGTVYVTILPPIEPEIFSINGLQETADIVKQQIQNQMTKEVL